MPVEQIHLHEVGALDSIIDIVGAVFAIEWLRPTAIVASPLNVGSGMVNCAHGVFPVPAPATVRLLAGVPVYCRAVPSELVTPTGALLMTGYAAAFGPLPPMRVERIGYGAGDRDFKNAPNVLRVLVGESAQDQPRTERIVVLECEIDDMNPQLFGPLMDRLYAAGALDVFYAPVQMKKNRPGTLRDGARAARAARGRSPAILFARRRRSACAIRRCMRERLDREMRDGRHAARHDAVQGGAPRRPGRQRGARVRRLRARRGRARRARSRTCRPSRSRPGWMRRLAAERSELHVPAST